MTPRSALVVALIGLVIAVAAAIPLFFYGGVVPANDDDATDLVVLALGGMLGLTILVVGLIIVAATAWRGKHRRPL